MTTSNLVSIEGGGVTTFERAAARLMNKLMDRKDWVWLQESMLMMLAKEDRISNLSGAFDDFFDEAFKKYGCPTCGKKGVAQEDGMLECTECIREKEGAGLDV